MSDTHPLMMVRIGVTAWVRVRIDLKIFLKFFDQTTQRNTLIHKNDTLMKILLNNFLIFYYAA